MRKNLLLRFYCAFVVISGDFESFRVSLYDLFVLEVFVSCKNAVLSNLVRFHASLLYFVGISGHFMWFLVILFRSRGIFE